jgi:histidinol phosphatase-like enzyme (inositol monophosphatase family)
VHLADVASAEILPLFRTQIGVDNKAAPGRFDPVTIADRNAETAIRREISRVYPEHGVMGEEHGFQPGASPYTWVIDPIDGTRAFILGQLHWGVLIALNDGVRPIVGVMRQPYTGETFVGSELGAELRRMGNVQALATRTTTRLEDAIVCATDPGMFEAPEHRRSFERLTRRARSVRYGGDCYTPCLVAAGCADLVVEVGLKPWDVQPLIPIVERAGGVMTSWAGERADAATDMVVASNRELHAQVIEVLNAG